MRQRRISPSDPRKVEKMFVNPDVGRGGSESGGEEDRVSKRSLLSKVTPSVERNLGMIRNVR